MFTRLFKKNRTPAVPTFAWCEPATAGPMAPNHLRVIGEEGIKLTGGAPGSAMCGRDLRYGWDLKREVTPETVTRLATPRDGDGHVWACLPCVTAYQAHPEGHPLPALEPIILEHHLTR